MKSFLNLQTSSIPTSWLARETTPSTGTPTIMNYAETGDTGLHQYLCSSV